MVNKKKELLNFVECDSVEEANKIDLSEYRLSEYLSKSRHKYVFMRRAKRLGL